MYLHRELVKKLAFGQLKTFTDRGYGFIESLFHDRDIFLHIKSINHLGLKELLNNEIYYSGEITFSESTRDHYSSHYGLIFSKSNWEYYQLNLWFSVEETSKGLNATNIWPNLKQVSSDIICSSIDELIYIIINNLRVVDVTLFSELFGDERISDAQLSPFLNWEPFLANPISTFFVLRPSQIDVFRSKVDLERISKIWCNEILPLPPRIEEFTEQLFGNEQLELFKIEREIIRTEHRKKVAEQIRLREEQEAQKRNQLIANLVLKYRANPKGIRADDYMHKVCINCGSQNIQDFNHNRRCLNCGSQWYFNHCWNCRRKSYVDSRDPETLQCSVCGWYKCATCGACSPGCKSYRV